MNGKEVFGIIFFIYGFYTLYFFELIGSIEHQADIGLFVLLALIPCVYLLIPSKDNKVFLKEGLISVCTFLFLATAALFTYTAIQRGRIDHYTLEKVNSTTILFVSFVAASLMTYFNIKSFKAKTFDEKFCIWLYSFGLFAAQIIFAIVALAFLYIGV